MKKTKEEDLRPFEIQSLNEDVLGNLSIEELEERLEMQILHVSEAQWCVINICGVDCGHNSCPSQCGAQCGMLCGADCGTLCGADACGADGGGGCGSDGPPLPI